jgi:hypothetical protein
MRFVCYAMPNAYLKDATQKMVLRLDQTPNAKRVIYESKRQTPNAKRSKGVRSGAVVKRLKQPAP